MASFPKPKRITDRKYLKWVKTLNCCAPDVFPESFSRDGCDLPIDPHHVTPVSLRGSDYTAIPLCRGHHDFLQSRVHLRPEMLDFARTLNQRFRREHSAAQRSERQQQIPTRKSRLTIRAWAVLTSKSWGNHLTPQGLDNCQFPIFETLRAAEAYRDEDRAVRGRIVRVQIRLEGTK